MKFSVTLFGGALLLLCGIFLSGCLPSAQSQLDEEKEPHFMAGKGRVNAMDYRGAIESFEKALEVNPRSASAHFELGILFDQKESDAAAAIYHYEQYLKLRTKAGNAEIVRQRVTACKQELARTVSLGPVTEKQQRDLEKMVEENKRLTDENKRLNEELGKANEETAKWRAYVAALPKVATNQPPVVASPSLRTVSQPLASGQPGPAAVRAVEPTGQARGPGPSPPTASRMHTVKPRETLAAIARQYGLRLESLQAANPRLDPRRLRVGQTLSIPQPR